MIFLLVAAAVVVAAPLAAAVLVTVASLREDSARSLNRRPPGLLAAASRRLLCLRTGPEPGSDRAPALPTADSSSPSPEELEIPPPRSDFDDQTLTMPRS